MSAEETLPAASPDSSNDWGTESIDPDAYLRRIGYDGPRDATRETFLALHRAHRGTIAFENIDVVLERGVSLDMTDLQRKLVTAGRGGYCYEHNLLFAGVLERFGFRVSRQLARVRRGTRQLRYRAHAALVVTVGNEPWLADVGFGDEGLIEPIPLFPGSIAKAGDWTWRVVREADQWLLQSLHPDDWFDLYSFRDERHFAVDFEATNYYTTHSTRSTFVGKLIVMRGTENVRYLLRERQFVTSYPDGRTERVEKTDAQAVQVLRDVFDIRLTPEEASLLRQHLAAS
ncbi:arylamine N-acetyltransferase family protein [Streptomyces litchfieldiae]|uniref:Arylamine N-acetyltransferase n=1 Tax=Streptomyces litchfieldiae TaxID=3075543 RepID=A0ABU2MXQ9_9ACTN|nr:arylamine N-acetyltransferase [Streptomyces sp. DSM 44938]MDT0345809.1 arylamine N-acetyltransferase [Streptomyces sp. DSM 44938]